MPDANEDRSRFRTVRDFLRRMLGRIPPQAPGDPYAYRRARAERSKRPSRRRIRRRLLSRVSTSPPIGDRQMRDAFFDPPPIPHMITTMPHQSTDEQFLRSALELARRGVGLASPNPYVGAVIVDARAQIAG